MNRLLKKDWWEEHKFDVYYSLCIMTAGSLLHFTYEWSGRNALVALFSAINESVWEHLKLFFVPAFFFTLFTYYLIGEKEPDYLWCQTKSILSGLLFITTTYYTFIGITRRENMWVDIAIFYMAAIFAGIVGGVCRKKAENRNTKKWMFGNNKKPTEHKKSKGYAKYAGVILLLLWALFVWLTYNRETSLIEWFPGLLKG